MAPAHTPIDRFLQGINTANLELMLSAFASNAEVIDNGKSFRGDAIRDLCERGIIGHHTEVNVLEQEHPGDGRAYVHVTIDGDFGKDFGIHDPFELFLAAKFDNDKIQHLEMGDLNPKRPAMRAVYASVGNPTDPLSSIRIDRRNVPEVKEGYVRVRMQAVGLNFHDIFTLRGVGMHEIRFPMILGNEGAGVLDDGTEIAIFPNLSTDPDFKGDETIDPHRHVFGELVQGNLAEYAVIPKRNAVPRPNNLDANSASVMGIAWLTAYRMMFNRAHLRAGQTVLVQGSSGGESTLDTTSVICVRSLELMCYTGVTTALIQMGSAAGYRVWTTGRTGAKRALAQSLGAEQTFEPLARLPNLVDAVFDTSGAATLSHSLASVKPGGTVVSCGIHSDGGSTDVAINLMHLFVNQISLTGVYTGTREEFVDLLNFVSAKGIKPYIGKVLPLERAGEGLRDIWEGKTDGKIVITI
ncbi:Zn-dependent oxidoreductase, NADPH:quinone reductase [Cladophialophora carrionii]|uniref:Zn-dependent oxidoreductase, NADPH:quinone reductase n=1 Tax=Cladophialophora carrionii TaxID=86049 RepID=A0A1C1D164_9EURO|nr:Zn-dependent oxidoreductase, NADPH:quinone reductase [Cladophialophora carrionii]